MSYHAISVIGSLRYLDHVANPSTDISSSIAVLFDRLLVKIDSAEGERRSRSGILIPATAQLAKRLTWASVVAVGPHVRAVSAGQRILFSADDQYEVEVDGEELVLLRERDVHAVAKQGADPSAGLYL
jgi:chaperonin GroES